MTALLLVYLLARPCLPLAWPLPALELWWLYQRRQRSGPAQLELGLWELAAGWWQPWVWPARWLALWLWNRWPGRLSLCLVTFLGYFLWGPANDLGGALMVCLWSWWWCPTSRIEAQPQRWGQRP